jgi:hypothetical protein
LSIAGAIPPARRDNCRRLYVRIFLQEHCQAALFLQK